MSKRTHDEKVHRRRRLEKQRHRRNVSLQARQREMARRALYPEIEFLGGDADPRWVEAVTRTLKRINFEDRNYFSERDSELCRRHKQLGAVRLIESLREEPSPESTVLAHRYASLLGDVLFRQMTPDQWRVCPVGHESKGPLPIHDVHVTPADTRFQVSFSSLRRGPRGGYGTRRDHEILVENEPARIFFSEHAIERIAQRLIPSELDYAAWGELYAFLDACRYFERCELADGSSSLSFYQDCFADQANAHAEPLFTRLAVAVVGSEIYSTPPGLRWYYRVGYAPAVRNGDHWVLKSLLPPGYAGTPEHSALRSMQMPSQVRLRFFSELNGWTAHSLVGAPDFELIRWFHANSNAQVVPFKGDLFAEQVSRRPLRPPRRLTLDEARAYGNPESSASEQSHSGVRTSGPPRFIDQS